MARNSNHIFDLLVGDDSDFVGIVAYTLYKRQKVEWLQQFEKTHGVRATDEQVEASFTAVARLDTQIEAYRQQAITLLEAFLSEALAADIQQAREEIQHSAVVQAVKRTFWGSVGENIVAGFLGSAITVLVAVVVWGISKGPENLWREAIETYTQPQPHTPAPQQ